MNTLTKTAIAAAAVLVVLIAAYQLLPGNGPGSQPTPTLTRTPTPIPTARPAVGNLDPGLYYIDSPSTPVRFTFEVPAGWTGRADGLVSKHADQPEELGFTPYAEVTHVYADACESAGTLTAVGPTVDDLVGALEAQVGSDATAPVDVVVGGYSGKRVDISVPAELDTATCRNPGVIQIWADPAETSFFAFFPNTEPASVYILDAKGERVVFTVGHSPSSSPADVAELEVIFNSIQFVP